MTGYATSSNQKFTDEQITQLINKITEPTKAIFYSTDLQKKTIEDSYGILLDSDDCIRVGLRFVRTNQIPNDAVFIMDI